MFSAHRKEVLTNAFKKMISVSSYQSLDMDKIRDYINRGVPLNTTNKDGNTLVFVLLSCMQSLLQALHKTVVNRNEMLSEIKQCECKLDELIELYKHIYPKLSMSAKDEALLSSTLDLIADCDVNINHPEAHGRLFSVLGSLETLAKNVSQEENPSSTYIAPSNAY